MKIKYLKVSVMFLAATLLTSSCVGSFSLFNRLAKWNTRATGSKFLNEIIFIIISPAYAVCCVADALVLNTIEFWSGSNPMAQNIGKTQNVTGKDGLIYAVTTLKDGYEVKSPKGEVVEFRRVLFRSFNDDGTIQANLQDGRHITVTPDEAGLFEVNMVQYGASFYAMR